MKPKALSLIFELDAAVSKASDSWCSELLRQVTDLLLGSLDSYSKEQIEIFDDILVRLIQGAEVPALVELSTKLAPLAAAPVNTVVGLARNEEAAVACPVLEAASALTDQALIDVAMVNRGGHLVAIAGRKQLTEAVTDAVVDRGVVEASLKLASNLGARISERGFVKLIGQAKTDKTLAAAIAAREDMPAELAPFLKLTLA